MGECGLGHGEREEGGGVWKSRGGEQGMDGWVGVEGYRRIGIQGEVPRGSGQRIDGLCCDVM